MDNDLPTSMMEAIGVFRRGPEHLRRRFWETLPLYHTDCAGEWAGVYVIQEFGKTLYVGSSRNVTARLRSYPFKLTRRGVSTPWGILWDPRVRTCMCETHADALWLEARLIFRIQPQENRAGRDHLISPGRGPRPTPRAKGGQFCECQDCKTRGLHGCW
jgi:hypothetical protein